MSKLYVWSYSVLLSLLLVRLAAILCMSLFLSSTLSW